MPKKKTHTPSSNNDVGEALPLLSDIRTDAEAKFAAMEAAGVSIARNPSEIADALLRIYKG